MTHRLGSRLTAVAVGAVTAAAAAAGAGMWCFDVPESEEKFGEERESF